MLAAAMASGRDADVEAVAKLAKATTPEDAAEIEEQVVAYRAERQRLKDEAAAAARAKLAAAKFWENRSEEHTSELQSLMRISYAVFCLKKNTKTEKHTVCRY